MTHPGTRNQGKRAGAGEKGTSEESDKAIPPKKKVCLVVYDKGVTEEFDTETIARVARGNLPSGLVREYKTFDSAEEAKQFITGLVRPAEGQFAGTPHDHGVLPGLPEMTITRVINKPVAAVTPQKSNLRGMAALSKISFPKNPFSAIQAHSPIKLEGKHKGFLECVQKNAYANEAKVEINVFHYDGEPAPKYTVVAFDLVSPEKEETYWTHKADKWFDIFETARKGDFASMFDPMCLKYKLFTARDVSSTIDNNSALKKTIVNKSNKTTYQLAINKMYFLIPFEEATGEGIMKGVRAFADSACQEHARQAYYDLHPRSSSNVKDKIEPVDGAYWKILKAAFSVDVEIQYRKTLDCMFRNDEISYLMKELFNEERHPQDYTNMGLLNFAYGIIMDENSA